MRDIGAVAPAETLTPAEAHQPLRRDSGKAQQPRRPRKPPSDDDMVEAEQHQLDLEA